VPEKYHRILYLYGSWQYGNEIKQVIPSILAVGKESELRTQAQETREG
jgi:hypothetical protein